MSSVATASIHKIGDTFRSAKFEPRQNKTSYFENLVMSFRDSDFSVSWKIFTRQANRTKVVLLTVMDFVDTPTLQFEAV